MKSLKDLKQSIKDKQDQFSQMNHQEQVVGFSVGWDSCLVWLVEDKGLDLKDLH